MSGLIAQRPAQPGEDRVVRWVAGLLVGALAAFQLVRMWPSLWLPWYHKADEMVYTWEVLRFLRLDFHQRWFGGPATAFMLLSAFLWSAGHRVLLVCGLTHLGSPSAFAFAHLDELHALMRILTMSFYFGSVALTYKIGRRLTNVCGGAVAAVLLVTLPAYCIAGQSARTESMGVFFTLLAVWWTFRGRETGRVRFYLWAGVAAGVATNARFHSALAALPVMLAVPIFYRPTGTESDKSDAAVTTPPLYLALAGAFAAFFLAGALVVVGLRWGVVQAGVVTHTMLVTTRAPGLTGALRVLQEIWLILGTVLPAIFAAYFIPRLRRYAAVIVNPTVITLLAGFAAGFLISNLTFLWQGEFQLRSVEWYTNWHDPARAKLGLAESWWQVICYCFTIAQPEAAVGVALALGIALALWRRDRALWPIVVGGVVAFAAQPPRMLCLPHHVLPWMPFLAILAAYPPAAAYGWVGSDRASRVTLLLTVLGLTLLAVGDRLPAREVDRSSHFARCRVVEEMTRWMEENTPEDAELFLAYDAFNDQSFYNWFESQGVAPPDDWEKNTTRHYRFWWYGRAELVGRSGFLAFCRSDLDRCRNAPARTMDPAGADGFEPVHTFAPGQPCSITVYRFDLRAEAPSGLP